MCDCISQLVVKVWNFGCKAKWILTFFVVWKWPLTKTAMHEFYLFNHFVTYASFIKTYHSEIMSVLHILQWRNSSFFVCDKFLKYKFNHLEWKKKHIKCRRTSRRYRLLYQFTRQNVGMLQISSTIWFQNW